MCFTVGWKIVIHDILSFLAGVVKFIYVFLHQIVWQIMVGGVIFGLFSTVICNLGCREHSHFSIILGLPVAIFN